MLMTRAVARVVDPRLSERIAATMARLQQAVSGGGDAIGEARALQADMATLIARLEAQSFGPGELKGVLAALIDEGLTGQFRDYAGAEQATMAIGSVLNFLAKRGELIRVRDANAALDRLHAEVRNDETFRPERFRAALAELGRTVR